MTIWRPDGSGGSGGDYSTDVDTFLAASNTAGMQTALDLATYLASPPVIGGGIAAAGSFTTLTTSDTLIARRNSLTAVFDTTGNSDGRMEFQRASTRLGLFSWDTGLLQFQADSGNDLGFVISGSGDDIVFNRSSTSLMTLQGTGELILGEGVIRPLTDSTNAIQFQNAAGDADIAVINTTNGSLIVGHSGTRKIELDAASGAIDSINAALHLNRYTGNQVAVGATSDARFVVGQAGFVFPGLINVQNTIPTSHCFYGKTASGQSSDAFKLETDGGTNLFSVDSSGTTTTGNLNITNIQTFADDTAADAALNSGDIYQLTGNRTLYRKP